MSNSCINWDKQSWLSSKRYFDDLTKSLIKVLNLKSNSSILDVGCGRAHLIRNLSSKIDFDNILIGVEPINHKKSDNKKIKVFNQSIQDFLKQNKNRYDFIIFKQVLHLIPLIERNKLYRLICNTLSSKGKIVILQMDKNHNFPSFPLMRQRLQASISKHDEIINELNLNFSNMKEEKFKFNVKISKKDYLNMVKNRFISILTNLTNSEIKEGCSYINQNYPSDIIFDDILNIIIVG